MTSKQWQQIIIHLLLAVVVVFSVYPLLIMLVGSFKTAEELSANPAGLPHHPTFDNYLRLFNYNSNTLVRSFINSIYVSTAHTILTILVSALAAFAFAKYKFKGRSWMFVALLATMMVPGELSIPPLYIMFSRIGWLNSYAVQIFPGIASVFAMFMMRQYMLSIPDALIEAAKMDGARHWRIFSSIILPVSSPVIGALAILTFLHKWNDFLWPLIMINKQKFMPIMVILPTLNEKDSVWSIPWELIMTGCVVVTLPLIIVFLRFQDKFMSSVTMGAVKE
ncbi:carbohydrate ABC transporter permease [Paenibacillus cremeus]|uniref:Carbohydrate ABC transporter permease n=1 Tax=Paenibacillus cremeus TaxID=2163881 RepID=A0A559K5V1_9BACL|nr:carbohydrate ABC transporter permease [Paenibacillus cremeus]TVY07502.1 carbohydrate ABC transporter permease [Paenibacillus cremeus]